MEEKKIKLLQNQITKLNDNDFDLDAWKSSTVIILRRNQIFGTI